MPDIYHDFPIAADAARVFQAISTPAELAKWWTKRSAGRAQMGAEYELWFGSKYDWRARVSQCVPNKKFELEMTRSDADWNGSRVGFELESTSSTNSVLTCSVGVCRPDVSDVKDMIRQTRRHGSTNTTT